MNCFKTMKHKKGCSLFCKRVIAYLIDLIVINFFIVSAFGKIINPKDILTILESPEFTIASISIVLLSLAYWSVLEYSIHQSIGKMFFKLYVSGKNLTLGQCIVRNLSKPFFILLVLDVLYMKIKKTNQRYLEKISGTSIVYEKQ